MWTANQQTTDIIGHHTQGLVQVVSNNFDIDISSTNGKKKTQSLPVILVQPDNGDSSNVDLETMEMPKQNAKRRFKRL